MSRNIQAALDLAIETVGKDAYNHMNRAQRRALVYGPGRKQRSFRKLTNRRINHGNA